MPEKYIRREGLPLLLRHTGRTTLPEAPPPTAGGTRVVCLHDAGLQSSVFEDLLKEIEGRGGAAIAFDLPGHGRSGSLDSLSSIEAMAEMAGWVAQWCNIDRALVVGHGMGALVALEWARTKPEAVEGLVLCGTGNIFTLSDDAIDSMRNVTRGKAPRPFDPSRVAKASGKDLMRRAYMEGIKTDPRATLVDLEASRSWAEAFEASGSDSIRCPVRVVCGEAESENHRARAEEFAGAFASGSLHTVADAAHFVPLEKPADLAAELQAIETDRAGVA